jgi:hypothetical protein
MHMHRMLKLLLLALVADQSGNRCEAEVKLGNVNKVLVSQGRDAGDFVAVLTRAIAVAAAAPKKHPSSTASAEATSTETVH